MPVIRVSSLTDAIKKLKEKGFWIAGTTLAERSEEYTKIDKRCSFSYRLLVMKVKEWVKLLLMNVTSYINLPMLGKIQSLNASVAAGIIMYERIKSND